MAGDGLETSDLAGRWVGFYRHRWERMGTFPISAMVVQEGDRLTGEMYDQLTDRSDWLETLLQIQQKDLSPWIRARAEQLIRRYGFESVACKSHLPESSDLEGRIEGSRVEFTKTYRGPVVYEWTVGGRPWRSFRRNRHRVYYSGDLDHQRGCITGEWVTRYRVPLARFLPPTARGVFELYREPS